MNLPSQTALEDAALQLEYAAAKLAPLLEMLALRCEQAPSDPAQRPRYEQNAALLRALKAYFPAVDNLLSLQEQQVSEMRKEMGAAQRRYAQMGIERDYFRAELQQINQRYYDSLDLFKLLHNRFHAHAA